MKNNKLTTVLFSLITLLFFGSCQKTETTYDCINGNCVEVMDGNGVYTTLLNCQNNCVSITYNCVNGNCVEAMNGDGIYTSLINCQNNCLIDCLDFTDQRDGQFYEVKQIGNQCWMTQNLNYATANSYCFDNNTSNCSKFGKLYDWLTCVNSCPSGWHVPSVEEWDELINYLGGKDVAGGKMRATTEWNSPNKGATNSSGFSGLPGGFRNPDNGSFPPFGLSGFWWTSESQNQDFAYFRQLYFDYEHIIESQTNKLYGNSCRCIKD